MSGWSAPTELRRLGADGLDWAQFISPVGVAGRGNVPAAVLILFGPLLNESTRPAGPEGLDLLFVERSSTLRDHPGQVAFPGGRLDATDDGPVQAALREAQEETGLKPDGVDVLGTLASVPLPVSNHQVTPVLSWWRTPSITGVVDPAECSRVFTLPVSQLVAPEHRFSATIRREGRTLAGPAFVVEDTIIWGFTGLLLSGLLESVGWAKPWDENRTVDVLP